MNNKIINSIEKLQEPHRPFNQTLSSNVEDSMNQGGVEEGNMNQGGVEEGNMNQGGVDDLYNIYNIINYHATLDGYITDLGNDNDKVTTSLYDDNIHFYKYINEEVSLKIIKEKNKDIIINNNENYYSFIESYTYSNSGKNIIDIFDRTITKNAYFEFRPYTRGKYQFIFKSLDIKKTFNKISYKISNLF